MSGQWRAVKECVQSDHWDGPPLYKVGQDQQQHLLSHLDAILQNAAVAVEIFADTSGRHADAPPYKKVTDNVDDEN